MAELGWQALVVPEPYGGLGLGLSELVVVLEMLGRNLAPDPFLWTLLAGVAIADAGTEAQAERWLPAIAEGSTVATLAWSEAQSRYESARCRCRRSTTAEPGTLVGQKVHVPAGGAVDLFVVLCRDSGAEDDPAGLTLVIVEANAEGLVVTPEQRVDGRMGATLDLSGVPVSPGAILGQAGSALQTVERVTDMAAVGLAAEMLGAATHALEMTLAYMRDREQFGVPIASFQALQHRAAAVFTQVELARSAVLGAARALDAGAPGAPAMASMAKVQASKALELAAKEGIQLHGGVGMTDEYDIGLFLKRHRDAETTFGDRGWHLSRWATLSGY